MDPKALYNISYGLYLLSVEESGKDNACIINTVMQVAENPVRIVIAVSKSNLTHDMLVRTGKCNVSSITTEADFALFQRFGMQSGRDADKFSGFEDVSRSANGVYYLQKACNTYFSLRVYETLDLGTHTLFMTELENTELLSDKPCCTYTYYQTDIKPKKAQNTASGWRCRICNYLYEGENLPDDYICPICKHGREAFEKED